MLQTSQKASKPERVMTTRTFAKKSGRQHGNVMSMLRKLVENGELDLQESYYTNGNGSRQYGEFKLTLGDFEKIAHRLKEKEIKGVRKYFGVQPGTAVEEVQTDPPKQLTLLAEPVCPRGGELTMSSEEIASLTGKQHGHVMRDIRAMLEDLGISTQSKFGASKKDGSGRAVPYYNLPRRETDILLTGYSTALRAKVIDRWRELEAQVAEPQFKAPTTLLGALQLAAKLEEQRTALTHQVEVQEQKIAQDAPKVEVYHQIADSTGLIGFQKFCTQLNLKQKEVKHWMREIGWLRAHQYAVNPLPTAVAVDAGYCKIRNFTTESGKLVQRIWFTGKAITYATEKAPGYIRKDAA